jgi:signal transduction histidine kinase/ActR/RegA family two-component response regulator
VKKRNMEENETLKGFSLCKKTRSQLVAFGMISGVLFVGTAIGIGLFFGIQNQEINGIRNNFRQDSAALFSRLQALAQSNAEAIQLLSRTICIGVSFTPFGLSRQQYRLLVGDLTVVGNEAIHWVPRVPSDLRPVYESDSEIQQLVPGFTFWQNVYTNKKNVTPKEEYFPIFYSEPLSRNLPALGFDLSSNIDRNYSMHLARDLNRVVSSSPFELILSNNSLGLILFQPVYFHENTSTFTVHACSPSTLESRHSNLKGFVVGIFNPEKFLEEATQFFGFESSFGYFYIFDQLSNQRLALWPPPQLHPDFSAFEFQTFSQFEMRADSQFVFSTIQYFPFANRTLTFAGGLDVKRLNALRTTLAPLLLSAVLIFTLLLALMVALRTHRTFQLENLILLVTQTRSESEEAKQKAIEADLAKTSFLQNMSHEIRTPLNGIVGMVELLRQSALSMEQLDFIQTIKGCSRVLLVFVSNVLDIHKIEKGKFELNPQPVNFVELIQEIVSVTEVMKTAHQSISVYFREDIPPSIVIDAPHTTQLFLNLLNNAIKVTEKGLISIGIAAKRLKEKSRKKWEKNIPYIDWEKIWQNGKVRGINPNSFLKTQGDSFRKFQRFVNCDDGNLKGKISPKKWKVGEEVEIYCYVSDSSTSSFDSQSNVDHVDLGVVICKQLCKMMSGSFWSTPEEGKGNTFHFTFRSLVGKEEQELEIKTLESEPCERKYSEEALLKIQTKSHKYCDKFVLITDDNIVNQKVFKNILKRILPEENIYVANHGKEAVEMCKEMHFHFILMDISMPIMNGIEATKLLRSDEFGLCRKSFICAMTGLAFEEEKIKCIDAGMDHFLTKPIKPTELCGLLRKLLSAACV